MTVGRRLRPSLGKRDLRVSRGQDEEEGFAPFNADRPLKLKKPFDADKPIFKKGGKVKKRK